MGVVHSQKQKRGKKRGGGQKKNHWMQQTHCATVSKMYDNHSSKMRDN